MKRKHCRPYVLRAIEITGGSADWRDERSPTWDGRMWHFARVKNEGDLLHEVAHWIIAPAAARLLENFGLGTDPDDGPFTPVDLGPFLADSVEMRRNLATLAERAPDTAIAIVREKTDREEALAAVVTIVLLRIAGLAWAKRVREGEYFAVGRDRPEIFWGYVRELSARGIDLDDPLAPFARTKESAA